MNFLLLLLVILVLYFAYLLGRVDYGNEKMLVLTKLTVVTLLICLVLFLMFVTYFKNEIGFYKFKEERIQRRIPHYFDYLDN